MTAFDLSLNHLLCLPRYFCPQCSNPQIILSQLHCREFVRRSKEFLKVENFHLQEREFLLFCLREIFRCLDFQKLYEHLQRVDEPYKNWNQFLQDNILCNRQSTLGIFFQKLRLQSKNEIYDRCCSNCRILLANLSKSFRCRESTKMH